MTVAVIAYTGIEAAANLAPEVRVGREALRRTVGAGAAVVLLVFVGMSVVALMALPVAPGVPHVGRQPSTAGYGTELGGQLHRGARARRRRGAHGRLRRRPAVAMPSRSSRRSC